MPLPIFTLRQRPDLRQEIFSAAFSPPVWPEFLLHDAAAQLYYAPPCLDAYLDYAFAVVENGSVVACAFSVPFAFDHADRPELPDGGWDEIIRWAHEDRISRRRATAVSALEICLLPRARGRGLSATILAASGENTRAPVHVPAKWVPVRR